MTPGGIILTSAQDRIEDEWFVRLQEKLKMSLGLPVRVVARHFIGRSFSDLTDFSENLARRMVLAAPNAEIRPLLEAQLKRISMSRKTRRTNG